MTANMCSLSATLLVIEHSSKVLGSHSPVITFPIVIAYWLSDSEHTFISCAHGENEQVLNSHSPIVCVGKDRLVMFNHCGLIEQYVEETCTANIEG